MIRSHLSPWCETGIRVPRTWKDATPCRHFRLAPVFFIVGTPDQGPWCFRRFQKWTKSYRTCTARVTRNVRENAKWNSISTCRWIRGTRGTNRWNIESFQRRKPGKRKKLMGNLHVDQRILEKSMIFSSPWKFLRFLTYWSKTADFLLQQGEAIDNSIILTNQGGSLWPGNQTMIFPLEHWTAFWSSPA